MAAVVAPALHPPGRVAVDTREAGGGVYATIATRERGVGGALPASFAHAAQRLAAVINVGHRVTGAFRPEVSGAPRSPSAFFDEVERANVDAREELEVEEDARLHALLFSHRDSDSDLHIRNRAVIGVGGRGLTLPAGAGCVMDGRLSLAKMQYQVRAGERRGEELCMVRKDPTTGLRVAMNYAPRTWGGSLAPTFARSFEEQGLPADRIDTADIPALPTVLHSILNNQWAYDEAELTAASALLQNAAGVDGLEAFHEDKRPFHVDPHDEEAEVFRYPNSDSLARRGLVVINSVDEWNVYTSHFADRSMFFAKSNADIMSLTLRGEAGGAEINERNVWTRTTRYNGRDERGMPPRSRGLSDEEGGRAYQWLFGLHHKRCEFMVCGMLMFNVFDAMLFFTLANQHGVHRDALARNMDLTGDADLLRKWQEIETRVRSREPIVAVSAKRERLVAEQCGYAGGIDFWQRCPHSVFNATGSDGIAHMVHIWVARILYPANASSAREPRLFVRPNPDFHLSSREITAALLHAQLRRASPGEDVDPDTPREMAEMREDAVRAEEERPAAAVLALGGGGEGAAAAPALPVLPALPVRRGRGRPKKDTRLSVLRAREAKNSQRRALVYALRAFQRGDKFHVTGRKKLKVVVTHTEYAADDANSRVGVYKREQKTDITLWLDPGNQPLHVCEDVARPRDPEFVLRALLATADAQLFTGDLCLPATGAEEEEKGDVEEKDEKEEEEVEVGRDAFVSRMICLEQARELLLSRLLREGAPVHPPVGGDAPHMRRLPCNDVNRILPAEVPVYCLAVHDEKSSNPWRIPASTGTAANVAEMRGGHRDKAIGGALSSSGVLLDRTAAGRRFSLLDALTAALRALPVEEKRMRVFTSSRARADGTWRRAAARSNGKDSPRRRIADAPLPPEGEGERRGVQLCADFTAQDAQQVLTLCNNPFLEAMPSHEPGGGLAYSNARSNFTDQLSALRDSTVRALCLLATGPALLVQMRGYRPAGMDKDAVSEFAYSVNTPEMEEREHLLRIVALEAARAGQVDRLFTVLGFTEVESHARLSRKELAEAKRKEQETARLRRVQAKADAQRRRTEQRLREQRSMDIQQKVRRVASAARAAQQAAERARKDANGTKDALARMRGRRHHSQIAEVEAVLEERLATAAEAEAQAEKLRAEAEKLRAEAEQLRAEHQRLLQQERDAAQMADQLDDIIEQNAEQDAEQEAGQVRRGPRTRSGYRGRS